MVKQKDKNCVRYELQTALADGLFKPAHNVKKGQRPKATIRREHSDGWIEFCCFEQLDDHDETVCLAVLNMAQDETRGCILDSQPKTNIGKTMRSLLDPKDAIYDEIAGFVETSIHEIATIMGIKRPNNFHYKAIRESLKRLSMVLTNERINSKGTEIYGQSAFFQPKVLDDGRLFIAFSRRLAQTAFGYKGWLYALIDLNERALLRSDTAKQVHKFLVSWMWGQGQRNIHIDKISEHIYGSDTWINYTNSGKTTMRSKIKKSLLKISDLNGWNITISGRGKKSQATIIKSKNNENLIHNETR